MTKRKDKKAPIKISAEETKQDNFEELSAKEEMAEEVTPADEVLIEEAVTDAIADEIVVEEKTQEAEEKVSENVKDKKEKSKSDKKDNDKKKPKKDKKEKKGLKRRTKETVSELKKVTWPKFPEVVKKTGVVIAVVLIFAVVLLGLDLLFGFLSSALMGKPFIPFK